MTDKPLERILDEFRQHCIDERRKMESIKFEDALDNLKKAGRELKILGESLLRSAKTEVPPIELKKIYGILDACAGRCLNRSEHYEIRKLVRALVSKYPSFMEQHGQELDCRLVTRAKQDLNQINIEITEIKDQATRYRQSALDKNARTVAARQILKNLQLENHGVYALMQKELAVCEAEVNNGRRCSLRKVKSLKRKAEKIEQEINKHIREVEQLHRETVDLKNASDQFAERQKTEIGERFILGTLNTDFLMGKSYKERLMYLAQTGCEK